MQWAVVLPLELTGKDRVPAVSYWLTVHPSCIIHSRLLGYTRRHLHRRLDLYLCCYRHLPQLPTVCDTVISDWPLTFLQARLRRRRVLDVLHQAHHGRDHAHGQHRLCLRWWPQLWALQRILGCSIVLRPRSFRERVQGGLLRFRNCCVLFRVSVLGAVRTRLTLRIVVRSWSVLLQLNIPTRARPFLALSK
jgi:hypothetical protein